MTKTTVVSNNPPTTLNPIPFVNHDTVQYDKEIRDRVESGRGGMRHKDPVLWVSDVKDPRERSTEGRFKTGTLQSPDLLSSRKEEGVRERETEEEDPHRGSVPVDTGKEVRRSRTLSSARRM